MTTQQVSKNGVVLKSHGTHFFTVELECGSSTQLDLETADFNLAHRIFNEWVKLRSTYKF